VRRRVSNLEDVEVAVVVVVEQRDARTGDLRKEERAVGPRLDLRIETHPRRDVLEQHGAGGSARRGLLVDAGLRGLAPGAAGEQRRDRERGKSLGVAAGHAGEKIHRITALRGAHRVTRTCEWPPR